ncbi:helix-turn-helix domain-containing protein, partial [Neobacillus mesonae]|uniref:helix-turn-helix domain-containing protein n=2 Tax=Neobacillus mesonae TaxID=1193713 RepID=UPI00203B7CAD
MVKYTSEYKETIVLEYLNGGGGLGGLAKKYGIGSRQTILNWVNRYKKYGEKAFDVRSTKSVFDGKFKLEVLEWMGRNGASLPETALHFNISTASAIWAWKRIYEEKGVEALFKRRGRPIQMTAKRDHQQKKKEESSELEILKRENRMLRIENEYLKKLEALIQEPKDT